jgi:protein SCO1/2
LHYNVGDPLVAHIVFLEVFMHQKVLLWGVAVVAILAVSAGILFISDRPSLHGAVINPPIHAADIKLTDSDGRPFALKDLQGKVVILYFGYTNCPDECPLTMAHLKLAVDQLGSRSNEVRVVMITTDPARDTSQAMKSFLGKFSPDFIGLVGSEVELAKVWSDYGVTVEDGGETHSYFIYMIDRAGNFRETFLPDSLPADIASDTRLLMDE